MLIGNDGGCKDFAEQEVFEESGVDRNEKRTKLKKKGGRIGDTPAPPL